MAQIVFNHVGGKPPFFDGTFFYYWKRKMKMYLGSINDIVYGVESHCIALLLDLVLVGEIIEINDSIVIFGHIPYLIVD